MHSYDILWDFDDLEHSLKRGFDNRYNFYAIFLGNELYLSGFELFYIGSTRMTSTSGRLLNNHDALQAALKINGISIYVALGEWREISFNSLSQTNETARSLETAMIYTLLPSFNQTSTKNYKGAKLIINNTLRSFCGLDLQVLIGKDQFQPFDLHGFSSSMTSYLETHFSENHVDGLIGLMTLIDENLISIHSTIKL
ncbi:MAG: hypothetical protein ACW98K_04560 [Candidatus Kariarchaeaceae archaeon]|jgi:hypothetical protein